MNIVLKVEEEIGILLSFNQAYELRRFWKIYNENIEASCFSPIVPVIEDYFLDRRDISIVAQMTNEFIKDIRNQHKYNLDDYLCAGFSLKEALLYCERHKYRAHNSNKVFLFDLEYDLSNIYDSFQKSIEDEISFSKAYNKNKKRPM